MNGGFPSVVNETSIPNFEQVIEYVQGSAYLAGLTGLV